MRLKPAINVFGGSGEPSTSERLYGFAAAKPVTTRVRIDPITPNRRKRAVYNAYMRFYNQTARAIKAGRACPWGLGIRLDRVKELGIKLDNAQEIRQVGDSKALASARLANAKLLLNPRWIKSG